MQVIYVDTLFLLNAIIDYFLLLTSAKIAGEPLKRLRFAIAAVLGGLYTVAIFIPELSFLSAVPCRFAVAIWMVLLAFWESSRLLRQCLIFFAVACGFGGGVYAIELLGGVPLALGSGVLYSEMDLKIVLLSGAGCYVVLSVVFARFGTHHGGGHQLCQVVIGIGDKVIQRTALVDTGNTLTDPISGQAVPVAHIEAIKELLPATLWQLWKETGEPTEFLAQLGQEPEWQRRFQLIPYRAVGIERGMLLALRVDKWLIDGKQDSGRLLALSPTPVSDGGAYHLLIGAK